jgi:hypothetical protein
VLGPTLGKRQVIFLDDVHCAPMDVFGHRHAVEFLRQWMDYGGWYTKGSEIAYNQVVDVQFVAATTPFKNTPSPISSRLTRHFVPLFFDPMGSDDLTTVFRTILQHFIVGRGDATPGSIRRSVAPLVQVSVAAYHSIQAVFKPTPTKRHYAFNIRDLSKLFAGVCRAAPENGRSKDCLFRLWFHEFQRIFQDRLSDAADLHRFDQIFEDGIMEHTVFQNLLSSEATDSDDDEAGNGNSKNSKNGPVTYARLSNESMFCDFWDQVDAPDQGDSKNDVKKTNAEATHKFTLRAEDDALYQGGNAAHEKPHFMPVNDFSAFSTVLETFLRDHAAATSQTGMGNGNKNAFTFVPFREAVKHTLRLARVIRNRNGHALLVGVHGSGRKTCTHLASHLYSYQVRARPPTCRHVFAPSHI